MRRFLITGLVFLGLGGLIGIWWQKHVADGQKVTSYTVFQQLFEPFVYAPWRDIYKSKEKPKKNAEGCAFCHIPHDQEYKFILARYEHCFVTLNIFPYTKGHVLVVPYQHGPSLGKLSPEARAEIMEAVSHSVEVLKEALNCPGFNIGVNMGAVAKASIPDHLHVHVMPRYEVDAGFAQLIGDVRVVAWDLPELHQLLHATYQKYLSQLAEDKRLSNKSLLSSFGPIFPPF